MTSTDDRVGVQAFVGVFFEELTRSGVEVVCISPGSRSTPLAVAASRTPGLRCIPLLDERSAGFFALGLARQSERPVALICTSGTAAANYLPAVLESHYARVPLIVLTADRPPELREWGAGQTIDQLGLYGGAVRRFVELPVPSAAPGMLRYARSLACRAVADALGRPAGPVHLNWPLREPLEPVPGVNHAELAGDDPLAAAGRGEQPFATVQPAEAAPSRAQVEWLRDLATTRSRGVIVAGPMPPDAQRNESIAALAGAAGWPILADPTSQLRRGPHVPGSPVVAHADLLLRSADFADAQRPDIVLRLGSTPVSKALRLWLEAAPPEHLLLIDPDGGWDDPSHLSSHVLRVDPGLLLGSVADSLGARRRDRREPGDAWLAGWLEADRRVAEGLVTRLAAPEELLEPDVVRVLADALPDGATLYVSNSMPVRDLDAFLPTDARALRVLCNRGANGIDGVVSSALGAATAGRGPVVLLIGDLALLHDLGGLLAARTEALDLSIVVLDNDGGGIFSFLPIADQGEAVDFERLFRTPHGLELQHAASLFGLEYARARTADQLVEALRPGLAGSGAGTRLIEVPIDRDANVKYFRELVAQSRSLACVASENAG